MEKQRPMGTVRFEPHLWNSCPDETSGTDSQECCWLPELKGKEKTLLKESLIHFCESTLFSSGGKNAVRLNIRSNLKVRVVFALPSIETFRREKRHLPRIDKSCVPWFPPAELFMTAITYSWYWAPASWIDWVKFTRDRKQIHRKRASNATATKVNKAVLPAEICIHALWLSVCERATSRRTQKQGLTVIMFAHEICGGIEWFLVCHFTHACHSLQHPLGTFADYIGCFNKQFLCPTMHTFVSAIQSVKQTADWKAKYVSSQRTWNLLATHLN